MAFQSLAGTVVRIDTGREVTILEEMVGVPSGLDIYGDLCFPAQIDERTQRFIRLREIIEVVKVPERPENAERSIQRDIRSLRARIDRIRNHRYSY